MAVEIKADRTNVYANLGYVDAAEMQRKAALAVKIIRAIKAQRLTQDVAAEVLGIDQEEISKITQGQFRAITETKMLEFVALLSNAEPIIGLARNASNRWMN